MTRISLCALTALLAGVASAAPPVMTNLNPAARPAGRTGQLTASNQLSAEVIYLLGGTNLGGTTAQLWAFDVTANNWSQLTPTNPPPARAWGAASWDAAQGRLIIYGGSAALSGPLRNDVWAYNPGANAWTQLTVSGPAPLARFLHSMVYVPHLQKHLVFGGGTGTTGNAEPTTVVSELWLLTPNIAAGTATWQALTPTGTAPGRCGACVAYDEARRRMIVFGGELANDTLGDTVQYDVDANRWEADAPTGTPPSKRGGTDCAFDPRSGRVLLYGGVTQSSGTPLSESFSYEPVQKVWTRLTPATNPGGLTYSGTAYSTSKNALFIHGGRDGVFTDSNATWTLKANAKPVAAASGGPNVDEGAVATLSAAGSMDPDAETLTYAWTQTGGPAVTLSGATSSTPTFTAPFVTANTPLAFNVTVSDGTDSSAATVSLTVVDLGQASALSVLSPPRTFTAGACPGAAGAVTVQLRNLLGAPYSAGPGGQAFTASSSSSGTVTWFSDAACTTVATGGGFVIPAGANTVTLYYRDTRVGAPSLSLSNASGLTNPPPQGHTVQAGAAASLLFSTPPRLFPLDGCSGPANVITVSLRDAFGNAAVAGSGGASFTATSSSPGARFFTDGACAASAPGGAFTLPAGAAGMSVYYRDPRPGTVSVGLTNTAGLSAPAPQDHRVAAGLTARIVASALRGDGALTVDFSCDCQAPNSPIRSYAWSFGDGFAVGPMTTRAFSPGRYHVRLTVVDESGRSAVDQVEVVVTAGGREPPLCAATALPDSGVAPMLTALRATSSQPLGSISSAKWTLWDGSEVNAAPLDRALDVAGTYTARLRVVDDEGMTCTDAVQIIARAGPSSALPPQLAFVPPAEAMCGEAARYLPGSGVLTLGRGPFQYSLEPVAGVALPAGLSVAPESGDIRWTPERQLAGSHRVLLKVSSPDGVDLQPLDVFVTCEPRAFGVAAGCSSAGDTGALTELTVLVLMALMHRRRAR